MEEVLCNKTVYKLKIMKFPKTKCNEIIQVLQKCNLTLTMIMRDNTCVPLRYQWCIILVNENVSRSTSHAYIFSFLFNPILH